jgi:hypothetical protein
MGDVIEYEPGSYPAGALIAVKGYDGDIEVRRVTGTEPPDGHDGSPGWIDPDEYLPVTAERITRSGASVGRPPLPDPPRGEPGGEADELLGEMSYRRTGPWVAHGYAKAWSAPVAKVPLDLGY